MLYKQNNFYFKKVWVYAFFLIKYTLTFYK